MTIDSERLRADAKAALNQNWFADGCTIKAHDSDDMQWAVASAHEECGYPEDLCTENARHIANMDPPTTLAILDALDAANARADKAEAQVTRLRKALDAIANGDIPRTVAKQWRADGKPSKHDQCLHGAFMYEDCGNCIADFARAALQEKPDE